MRQPFRISVLFVLGQLLYKTVTQQCGSEVSIFGWMLQGHIYNTMLAELPHTCVQVCREDNRCQSFNWVISLLKCEFSNRTKEARPEDFIPDPDRFYYKRDRNRGKKLFTIHYKQLWWLIKIKAKVSNHLIQIWTTSYRELMIRDNCTKQSRVTN